jgi:hypothetical protein
MLTTRVCGECGAQVTLPRASARDGPGRGIHENCRRTARRRGSQRIRPEVAHSKLRKCSPVVESAASRDVSRSSGSQHRPLEDAPRPWGIAVELISHQALIQQQWASARGA